MKKILSTLGTIILSLATAFSLNAQSISINQAIVQQPPYHVGDTLTMTYTVTNTSTNPRYFWLRYQYNNQALQFVPNSTVFSQGTSSQTYYTSWSNYQFTSNPNFSVGDLYNQYHTTPWNYVSNNSWNVGQLTVQRTDAAINGVIATQKYILLDQNNYNNIHKLDMSYGIDVNGSNITTINSNVLNLTIPSSNILGNSSAYKIMIAFPSGDTTITHLNAQLMNLNADGTTNWSVAPIAQTKFNAQGIATFTGLKVGQKFAAYVTPSFHLSYLDNIVTVSDAYKAFLGVSEVGLTGTSNYFTYPTLQKMIGNVSKSDTTFDNNDAYYLFSYVMGIDMSSNTNIPTSTANTMSFFSGKYKNWAAGLTMDHTFIIDSVAQVDTLAYAYGGDLNFSHSTDPSLIPGSVTGLSVKTPSVGTGTIAAFDVTQGFTPGGLASVSYNDTLSLSSTVVNGNVILTGTLTASNLAGLEVILQYDNSKLTLQNVNFDAGSTITNFSTINGNRLTFGSIDQIKTARIKPGVAYTLTFTTNTPLTDATGLFFTVLSDAVDGNGNKVNLIVE